MGFGFIGKRNDEFLIVDKCIMVLQGFGGENTWET
jgi:hypothetical protein